MKFDYEQFEEELEVLLAQDTISGWEGFGPGHYRINGILDVWPRHKRYYRIYGGAHGQYRDLAELIASCG
jgi:hypothetical protein